jgi:hypothetical protein
VQGCHPPLVARAACDDPQCLIGPSPLAGPLCRLNVAARVQQCVNTARALGSTGTSTSLETTPADLPLT